MKHHQIAFLIAIISGVYWLVLIDSTARMEDDAAVLKGRLARYNNGVPTDYGSRVIRSFWDGITFGAFAEDGMFTEMNKLVNEGNTLEDQANSLISRYQNANFKKGIAGLVCLFALIYSAHLYEKTQKNDV